LEKEVRKAKKKDTKEGGAGRKKDRKKIKRISRKMDRR
jgi:hypothetical protein